MKRTYKTDLFSVTLYGRAGNALSQVGKIYQIGRQHGAETVFIMDTPDKPGHPGWHRVVPTDSGYRLPITKAEGGPLKRRQAVLITTRDCPTVIIANRRTGEIGATHAGRGQLIDYDNPCRESYGTIERLISILGITDGAEAEAYVTGGISACYFEHKDAAFVEPFVRLYGDKVIEDKDRLTLDMLRVITLKLANYGITKVAYDGLCTFITPWLGSRRAELSGIPNKTQLNWVLAVNHAEAL